MKISIFGLGYVGAVTAACFARDGHSVLGVDLDTTKLNMLRAGQSPIIEEGMPELVEAGVKAGRLSVTESATEAVHKTEVSLICVGTPSCRDGSLDTSVVRTVVDQIGAALKEKEQPHLIIVRSTLLPGTVNKMVIPLLEQTSGKTMGKGIEVFFNPEFLREGTSIKDFYNPPFTVVGSHNRQDAYKVRPLYESIKAAFMPTSIEVAEMIKCTCNVFHALKISFANEIGAVCKGLNIDSHEVMEILCADNKLNTSPAYLKPGFAFGGSCLPKDLRALDYQGRYLSQELPLIRSILPSNTIQIERAIRMILDTDKRKIGLLGLSFKQGTDDLRESPLVVLAERLLGKGLDLVIYDDNVSLAKLRGANKRYIEKEIPHLSRLMTNSLEQLFQKSDVAVIGNGSAAFSEAVQKYATSKHIVFDLVRLCQNEKSSQFEYQGFSW